MHLGRFHAVMADLSSHFADADLGGRLQKAADLLDAYAANRDADSLKEFRKAIENLKGSADVEDEDLFQPYAQQVIESLNLRDLFNPVFNEAIDKLIATSSFDQANLASELRSLKEELSEKIDDIDRISSSFDNLGVEVERVAKDEAELGLLLPREIVGEKLGNLSQEFGDLNKLARAINEIVGGDEYDPRVVTISSSWWQIFLDLSPEQILVWVLAIERIVALFKSNLEIKVLNQQLKDKQLPEKLTKQIEDEVEKRVKVQLDQLAKEIRKSNSKGKEPSRLNELETQLRHGLYYLAKRLSQGAQVEINIGIPSSPSAVQTAEGEEADKKKIAEYEQKLAYRAKLLELRKRARAISVETSNIEGAETLMIDVDKKPEA